MFIILSFKNFGIWRFYLSAFLFILTFFWHFHIMLLFVRCLNSRTTKDRVSMYFCYFLHFVSKKATKGRFLNNLRKKDDRPFTTEVCSHLSRLTIFFLLFCRFHFILELAHGRNDVALRYFWIFYVFSWMSNEEQTFDILNEKRRRKWISGWKKISEVG